MTSSPPPVWPTVESTTPPVSPAPVKAGRNAPVATLAAVALAGVIVGFTGSSVINHAPSLAGLGGLLSGNAPAANPAPPANAAPPVITTNPNPPAAANPQGGRTAGRGGNGGNGAQPSQPAQPAQNRGGNGAQPAGNRNPAAPAAAATTGTPVDAATQTAVQQAIQTIDDAQVKAVASNDLSGLSASATADFANGQKNVTQDLVDNGVSEIKLVNIEWGPATIDNGVVTATAFETWSTTYSDGTTEQSRDRNVYTLVQQDGSWKVQADEHPDALPGGLQGFPGGAQSIPGIPDNLLPPGFPNPFQNPAPRGQAGGNPSAPVQVQP